MPDESPPCLSCHVRAAQCRGLCVVCSNRLAVSVRHGETTWAELEESGQALPAKSRRARMAQWFRQLKKGD